MWVNNYRLIDGHSSFLIFVLAILFVAVLLLVDHLVELVGVNALDAEFVDDLVHQVVIDVDVFSRLDLGLLLIFNLGGVSGDGLVWLLAEQKCLLQGFLLVLTFIVVVHVVIIVLVDTKARLDARLPLLRDSRMFLCNCWQRIGSGLVLLLLSQRHKNGLGQLWISVGVDSKGSERIVRGGWVAASGVGTATHSGLLHHDDRRRDDHVSDVAAGRNVHKVAGLVFVLALVGRVNKRLEARDVVRVRKVDHTD